MQQRISILSESVTKGNSTELPFLVGKCRGSTGFPSPAGGGWGSVTAALCAPPLPGMGDRSRNRVIMSGTSLAAASIATLLISTLAFAGPPARTHDVEPDDYFTIGTIFSCAASPDGQHLVYAEIRWDESLDGRNSDLWVVERKTKNVRRLTFDTAFDSGLSWSPDGKHIYFTSSRKRAGEKKPPYDGTKQVWRISPTGGEPFAVTRIEDGIGHYELSKDGRTLYYTVSEEHTDDAFKDVRKKNKHLEYGHGVTEFSQVWALDLESWRARMLVDEQRVIQAFAVSPDEKRIAMITTPDDNLITNEGRSRVDVYDVDTEEVRIVTDEGWRSTHPSPYGWVEGPSWSADGRALAFSLSFDGYPTELYVARCSGDDVSVRMLNRPDEIDVADGAHLHWRGDSHELYFVGESRARKWVCGLQDVLEGQGDELRQLTKGDVVIGSFCFDEAGDDLFVVMGTTKHPWDVFHRGVGQGSGMLERLTRVNPQVDTWKLPQIHIVKWTAPDGVEVEGILELPSDYNSGEPLPMIVELHGGPTSATLYRLRLWIYGRTLMAAKGYALLSPNYRGSTGYGRKFMTDLVGHENDVEIKDILSGVDAMIKRAFADPERLAIMGWSNGGYLTNCIITQTDRFKAASSGAGVLDMVIQWGSEDTPGHVVNYMQGLPWAVPDAYRKASPIFGLDKVSTPTLIHVGGNDSRCPPAHSRGLYRALRHYLKVPTELVVYPDEGHGLRKYKNRKAKMEWDLAWFEHHLLGKTDEEKAEDEKESSQGAPPLPGVGD